MKKLSLLLMVGIILITFASCNKKCKCTSVVTKNGVVVSEYKEELDNEGGGSCSDLNYWKESDLGKAEFTCK